MTKVNLEYCSMSSILKAVCEVFEVSKEELLSKRRYKELIKPRHVFYYLAHSLTDKSLVGIGRYLDKDHTTIMYGADKIRNEKKTNKDLCVLLDEVEALALSHELNRVEQLSVYREEVREMIFRMKMEKVDGIRAERIANS